ncbi:uncharacterized protein LOC127288405 isoform X2 [Leptopilina boulardi]|uniref:uncharacterized protein LOC127288405 isoform X2 n=1 Tax=Leptopilina boulardi TaxID=63433 RepID=UPI0021F68D21|nr:uncharacterized protein LOC127288405 isoform X2 [Leptopilina boulardi]
MANLPGSSTTALPKPPTMLEQLLEEINFQRTKEMRQLLKDDSGFVMLQGTTYWTDLFVRHFLFQAEHTIDGDDLLFFVRKKHVKTSSRYLPKFETEVNVFRKDSKKLPIGDPDIDWEETVYLNLVVHQFDYTLTLATCTRTSPKELQVLRRHSQKVYASPSRRRMDAKGDLEEMTYPHICFMVDNFDEVFCDILVRDGEMVCVELVASDRNGAIQGVIFLGSIRYDALKKVYDARSSLSSKVAQRMTFGLFSGATSQRVEFVRMKGPQGKGHAEMAVTKPKGSGAETPTSEPGYCATDLWDADWEDAEDLFMYRHQRRLSDPSANLNNFVRGGWRTKPDSAATKARSENEGLDSMANGLSEIEAGDVRDGIKNHQQTIEVGSELLVTTGASLTEDNVRQKLDAGAILVDGKEELPLDYDDNLRNHQQRPFLDERMSFEEQEEEEEEHQNKILPPKLDGRRLNLDVIRGYGSDSDDAFIKKKNHNKSENEFNGAKDKNANAKLMRSQSCTHRQSATLPRPRRRRAFSGSFAENPLPPHRVTTDGTAIYYWCELPRRPGSQELDDGAYNPLWTMRGFTQTFHFWKETKRAQSVPLNAFLTYITLPWWSIAKDILDHRDGPILTF